MIPFLIFSQDLIIKKSGEIVNCKITKEDSINVYLNMRINGRLISTYISKDQIKEFQYLIKMRVIYVVNAFINVLYCFYQLKSLKKKCRD